MSINKEQAGKMVWSYYNLSPVQAEAQSKVSKLKPIEVKPVDLDIVMNAMSQSDPELSE